MGCSSSGTDLCVHSPAESGSTRVQIFDVGSSKALSDRQGALLFALGIRVQQSKLEVNKVAQ